MCIIVQIRAVMDVSVLLLDGLREKTMNLKQKAVMAYDIWADLNSTPKDKKDIELTKWVELYLIDAAVKELTDFATCQLCEEHMTPKCVKQHPEEMVVSITRVNDVFGWREG